MNRLGIFATVVTLLFALGVGSNQVVAREGMWLPSQAEAIAQDLRRSGLKLDPATLSRFDTSPLDAIVSLGGCSAAFVSSEGLVVTAHHCVQGAVQYASSQERDYLRDGFLAGSFADETPASPGVRMYLLESERDVTLEMLRDVDLQSDAKTRSDHISSIQRKLIKACESDPDRHCVVREYYGGVRYVLQSSRVIRDVRLVYAPAAGIAAFGGSTDNWMWPRHCGDFGFFRAYVAPDGSSKPYSPDNVPYRPKSWLKISAAGVKEGDFVMVAGFPNATYRLATAAEARSMFDTQIPLRQQATARYAELVKRATAGSGEKTLLYAPLLLGLENVAKKLSGQMGGADRMHLIDRKVADERAFREWTAQDIRSRGSYTQSLDAIGRLTGETELQFRQGHAGQLLERSQMFDLALSLYRWAKELEKPESARASGYQDRDLPRMRQRLERVDRRFDADVDRNLFVAALTDYRKLDDADPAVLAILESADVDQAWLRTELTSIEGRMKWLESKPAAFEASDDLFIRLAVAAYPMLRTLERDSKATEARIERERPHYLDGQQRFASDAGKILYPDADGSLRIAYGRVSEKTVDGQIWTPFTTTEGLARKHIGKGEFNAPARLIDAIERRKFGQYALPGTDNVPVDFLSTIDITSGNSGSATLNAQGELIGIAFDGTYDGIISDWAFDDRTHRAIHVDSRFMLWLMHMVDGADRIIEEMDIVGMDGAGP